MAYLRNAKNEQITSLRSLVEEEMFGLLVKSKQVAV